MRSTAFRSPAIDRRRAATSFFVSVFMRPSYPRGWGRGCGNGGHTRWMPHPRRSQRPTGVSPLFTAAEIAADPAKARGTPLAARVRPRELAEFVRQPHLVGDGRVLRKAIDAGQLPSMILWGPPGPGKTTLPGIAAGRATPRFVALSAVSAGAAHPRPAGAGAPPPP